MTPTFLIADKWRWLAHPYASQFGHTIYIRRGQGDMEALEAARKVLAGNGALAITPVVGSLLIGVSPTDPAGLGAVSLLLVLVALAATWFPAWQASAVDPIVALRDQ